MGKKVLVIGSSGLVGSALMDVLVEKEYDVIGTNSKSLDLSNWFDIRIFLAKTMPDEIYLPAAITQVDRCETDPLAHKVNVDGVRTILNWAGGRVKVIFFSSSYVFSGKSDCGRGYSVWDIPHPLQIYGTQKLLSEAATLKYPDNLVIRTSAIFGREEKRKNFGYQVLKSLEASKKHIAPTDQWINPILASDLASSVVSMVECGVSGVLHVAGDEDVSKYDFGKDIANEFGYDTKLIEPVFTSQLGQIAKRPVNGCLRTSIKPKYTYLESIEKFHAEY